MNNAGSIKKEGEDGHWMGVGATHDLSVCLLITQKSVSSKQMASSNTSLMIRDMQIKTANLTHIRRATMQNKEQETSVGEDVKKLESLCKADRNVKQCSNYGKQHGISSQNLKKD